MDRSRREFLARTGCAALGMAAFQAGLDKLGLISALARPAVADYRALVCIFLGGGNDGNNTIVPLDTTGYKNYSDVRASPGLALPKGTLLPITPSSLGAPFGLHPSMPELKTLFDGGRLAVVSNVGPLVQPLTRQQFQDDEPHPYALFSHSDQATQWQTARADQDTRIGWGGRTGDFAAAQNAGAVFPIVTSVTWGTSLFGLGLSTRPLGIAPAPTPLDEVLLLYGFYGSSGENARLASMNQLRTLDRSATLIAATSDATQQAYDISLALSTDPAVTTAFPHTDLGNQLKQVAKLIKLNQTAPSPLKRQIFYCEMGGFDTHSDQLGDHADLLAELSGGLKAFSRRDRRARGGIGRHDVHRFGLRPHAGAFGRRIRRRVRPRVGEPPVRHGRRRRRRGFLRGSGSQRHRLSDAHTRRARRHRRPRTLDPDLRRRAVRGDARRMVRRRSGRHPDDLPLDRPIHDAEPRVPGVGPARSISKASRPSP